MSNRARSWHALATLNARLLRNCFAEVSDTIAASRPSDRANSMAFVAVHLVEARHFVATQIGGARQRPFGDRFDKITHVQQVADFPPVVEILRAWDVLSAELDEALSHIDDGALDKPATHGFPLPIADTTVNGTLAFMFQHESYHIGQLALLRKLLGLDAMKYS